jgi:hypothetical protein
MSKHIFAICAFAISTPAICSPGALARQGLGPELQRIDRNDLCVTNGTVSALPDGRLAIDTPSSRAIIRTAAEKTGDQVAEIRFRYLGPTQTSKPLASGELRRQIGLKLRAADTCNLVYVMWHIAPDTSVAVSIKRNAGMHTHEQCGASGYINIKPQRHMEVPPIRPGETHTLRAELRGHDLTLAADRKVVWQGTLGDEVSSLNGPAGFRTDNARFEFEYYADSPTKSHAGHCVTSKGD